MYQPYNRSKSEKLSKEIQQESFSSNPKVKWYQVAFYDEESDGSMCCYDESFYEPEESEIALSYVKYIDETMKVFMIYEDGLQIELDREDESSV